MSTTHTEQPHVPPSELVPLFRRLPQPGETWRASDGLMGDVRIEACPVMPAPLLLSGAHSIGDRLVQFTQGGVQYALSIKDFMAFIPWTAVGSSGQGPRTYYAPRFYCVSGPHDERVSLRDAKASEAESFAFRVIRGGPSHTPMYPPGALAERAAREQVLHDLTQRLARISELSGETVEGFELASKQLLMLGRIARGEQ